MTPYEIAVAAVERFDEVRLRIPSDEVRARLTDVIHDAVLDAVADAEQRVTQRLGTDLWERAMMVAIAAMPLAGWDPEESANHAAKVADAVVAERMKRTKKRAPYSRGATGVEP